MLIRIFILFILLLSLGAQAQYEGIPLKIKDGTASVIQQKNLTLRYNNLFELFEHCEEAEIEIRAARTYGGMSTFFLAAGGGFLSISVISNFITYEDPIQGNTGASSEFEKRKKREKIFALIGVGSLATGAYLVSVKRNKRRKAVEIYNGLLEKKSAMESELQLDLALKGLGLKFTF